MILSQVRFDPNLGENMNNQNDYHGFIALVIYDNDYFNDSDSDLMKMPPLLKIDVKNINFYWINTTR